MKKTSTAAILLLLFIACNNSPKTDNKNSTGSWEPDAQDAFVKGCIPQVIKAAGMDSTKAKAYCDCMLSKVEKKFPKPEDATALTTAEASVMAKDCLK